MDNKTVISITYKIMRKINELLSSAQAFSPFIKYDATDQNR